MAIRAALSHRNSRFVRVGTSSPDTEWVLAQRGKDLDSIPMTIFRKSQFSFTLANRTRAANRAEHSQHSNSTKD
jgi:hypothetical protein